MPRTVLPGRTVSQRSFTDLCVLVLVDQEVFFHNREKLNVHEHLYVWQSKTTERSPVCEVCYFSSAAPREEQTVDNPPGKQPKFTSLEAKVARE